MVEVDARDRPAARPWSIDVARAAPGSAGRTGWCGAGRPARCPRSRNGRRTARARSACARSLAAACRPRRWPEHARRCGRRRRWWRPRRSVRSSRSASGPRSRGRRRSRSRSTGSASRIVPPSRSKWRTMPRPARWCRRARTRRRRRARACGSARRSRWSSSDCRRPAGCGTTAPARSFSLRTKPRDDRIDRAPRLVAGQLRAPPGAST